jgi:hypothetical protein
MSKLILIIGVASVLLINGCSETTEPKPLDAHKILTGNTKKTWKLTTIKWTGESKDDITYGLPTCIKDDLYIFYATTERLYEVRNGASKCDSDEPDRIVNDEWAFVNATATLTIIMPLLYEDGSLPFYVKKLTSKEMVLEIYLDQDSKYSYILTMQSVSEE